MVVDRSDECTQRRRGTEVSRRGQEIWDKEKVEERAASSEKEGEAVKLRDVDERVGLGASYAYCERVRAR